MTRIATTRKLTERKARRKQNELLSQQAGKLKARADQPRITEAELIRQAVAVFPQPPLAPGGKPAPADPAAWEKILAAFAATQKRSVASEPPR